MKMLIIVTYVIVAFLPISRANAADDCRSLQSMPVGQTAIVRGNANNSWGDCDDAVADATERLKEDFSFCRSKCLGNLEMGPIKSDCIPPAMSGDKARAFAQAEAACR